MDNKNVLVVGASGGIGNKVAETLLAAGYSVIGTYYQHAEKAEKMIRVNSIAPGWVLTPMTAGDGEEFLQKVAGINPLKRNADPVDVANLIKFLLSDNSDYLNGQVISLEGGYTNQDPTLLLEEESNKK